MIRRRGPALRERGEDGGEVRLGPAAKRIAGTDMRENELVIRRHPGGRQASRDGGIRGRVERHLDRVPHRIRVTTGP